MARHGLPLLVTARQRRHPKDAFDSPQVSCEVDGMAESVFIGQREALESEFAKKAGGT